jgi:hypothetical protein
VERTSTTQAISGALSRYVFFFLFKEADMVKRKRKTRLADRINRMHAKSITLTYVRASWSGRWKARASVDNEQALAAIDRWILELLPLSSNWGSSSSQDIIIFWRSSYDAFRLRFVSCHVPQNIRSVVGVELFIFALALKASTFALVGVGGLSILLSGILPYRWEPDLDTGGVTPIE